MNDWECYCDECTGKLEPCEYCSVMARKSKVCDRSCDSLTKEQWIVLTREHL